MYKQKMQAVRPTYSSGFTMVELLIAMSLGIFLLVGAYQLSITNKQAKRLESNLQQIQKNGRFAIDNLTYGIKIAGHSGFYGDLSTGVENVLNTPNDQRWDISIQSQGFDNVASNLTVAGITGFKAGTDVLLLKGMDSNTVPVVSNLNSSSMVVTDGSDISTGDIVLVSDVDQASLFQISTFTSATGTLTLAVGGSAPGNSALLSNEFDSNAEIGKYKPILFYIKTGRNSAPALFKASLVNNAGTLSFSEEELVSNIEDMQITYGVDTDSNDIIDGYINATTTTDWSQVLSIKVVLLATSNDDDLLPEDSSFSFDQELLTFTRDTTAADTANKRIKRVFKAYAPLKNSRF